MSADFEKEALDGLVFPSSEVLLSKEERQLLNKQLEQASTLGNLDKHKVHIRFEDSTGIKTIHTTIWALTEKRIMLKAGRSIPLHRIHSINLV
jgi:uncharacterized protein (UPF0248 family)